MVRSIKTKLFHQKCIHEFCILKFCIVGKAGKVTTNFAFFRRSADESVEAAVAKQLSNLYCDTTSYSAKSRNRPTTSNDLENYRLFFDRPTYFVTD